MSRQTISQGIVSTVGQVTSTVADALVLFVTLRKTYQMVKLASQAAASAPLAVMLLRDGGCLHDPVRCHPLNVVRFHLFRVGHQNAQPNGRNILLTTK